MYPPRATAPRKSSKGEVVSTEVLERPELKEADTGPEMFHYVRKEKIAESAVMGTLVMALCGEIFPVTKAPKPGSPVCPACKEIFDALPAGE
jgi:formylmethanofuran dehydrogenase subunit E